ncbi:MAG: hypothetical protein ACXVC6_03515 [Bacteroidia bacterium]
MNLRSEILREHSKKQCVKIVKWVGNDKNRFTELMNLMLHDEYRIAQRAAWPVSYCVEEYPSLMRPWYGRVIKRMQQKNIHNAIRRNSLRILENADIPEKYCGMLFELSNSYLHNLKEPIAVRVFSLSVMHNIAKFFPELKKEVKINAEELLHCGIPALEARSRLVIKALNK